MLSEMSQLLNRRKSTGSSNNQRKYSVRRASLPPLPSLLGEMSTSTNCSTHSRRLSIGSASSSLCGSTSLSPSHARAPQWNWAQSSVVQKADSGDSDSASNDSVANEFQRRRSLSFHVRTILPRKQRHGIVDLEAVLKSEVAHSHPDVAIGLHHNPELNICGTLSGKLATTSAETHEIKHLEVERAMRGRGIGQELCGTFMSICYPDTLMLYFDPGSKEESVEMAPEMALAAAITYLKSAMKAGYNSLSVYDVRGDWHEAPPCGSYEFYNATKCVSLAKQHANYWRKMNMVFQAVGGEEKL